MTSEIFTHHRVQTTDVTLHVVTAGNPDHPACILLHGFPEYWAGWREVAERLAESFYLIIPDQRGYNTSDTPFWIGDYKVDHLVQDVYDLIEWSGREQVVLAGHDWGGAVAWAVVSTHPERISHTIIVNVPHSRAMMKHVRSSLSQLRKSWYIFAFQIPLIPQILLRLFNFKLLRRTMINSALPNTFSEEDMQGYTTAWSQSGVTGMINWYRAMLRRGTAITYGTIESPVLIIWGKQDKFLSAEMAEMSLQYCTDASIRYVEEASHWILHEFPDEVVTYIEEFLDDTS